MAITFSLKKRPSVAAVQRLYGFSHWARHRKNVDVGRMLKNTPLFFSAWDGKVLVGMARAGTDFAFRAVLWDVIVDPDYVRRGIGSRLVRAFLKYPRLKTVESFWLSTTDKQPFYAALGFKPNTKNIMVYQRRKH